MAGIIGSKCIKGTGGSISVNISGYTVHLFTSNGTFTPAANGLIDVLAIGAGGDCGNPGSGGLPGGGGAGAAILTKFIPVTSGTSYPVILGTTTINGPGGRTIFNAPSVGVSSINAFGGASGSAGDLGGSGASSPNSSGGGGGPGPGLGGLGKNSRSFGFPGGNGSGSHSGGGGGAGSPGGNSPGSIPGLGGSGISIDHMTGNPTDIVSAGGGPGVTPSSNGNGGQSNVPGTSRPGAMYIRYY